MRLKMLMVGLTAAVAATAVDAQAALVQGNLYVLTTGATSAASGAVTIREFGYNGNGAFNLSPTNHLLDSSASGVTLPGAADHDGLVHVGPGGTSLTFAGYGTAAGTASVVTSSAPRVVASIDGNFNTTKTTVNGYAGLAIRAAVNAGNGQLYTGGNATTPVGAGGGQFSILNGSTTQLSSDDARSITLDRGTLWGTSSGRGGFSYNGLPAAPAASTIKMTSPYVKSDVVFLDLDNNGASETAYTTDGKNLIGKWHFDGANWSITGTFDGTKTAPQGSPSPNFNDINQMAAYVSNGNVNLVLGTLAGYLYQLTDSNGITNDFSAAFKSNLLPTPIYSTGDGSAIRGLVIVPEPTTLGALAAASLMMLRRRGADA